MAASRVIRPVLLTALGAGIVVGTLRIPATAAAQASPNEEAAVRAVIQQGVAAWSKGDGKAYAAPFTEDADYVTFGGALQKGTGEIGAAHQRLFDTVLRGTRLEGGVRSVRFVRPDVAIAHADYGILFPGQKEVAPDRKSLQTLVLVKRDGAWQITASQVTRVLPE